MMRLIVLAVVTVMWFEMSRIDAKRFKSKGNKSYPKDGWRSKCGSPPKPSYTPGNCGNPDWMGNTICDSPNPACPYLGCPTGFALIDMSYAYPNVPPFCAAQSIFFGGRCPPGSNNASSYDLGDDYCIILGAIDAFINTQTGDLSEVCVTNLTRTCCQPPALPPISTANCPSGFFLFDFNDISYEVLGMPCLTDVSLLGDSCPAGSFLLSDFFASDYNIFVDSTGTNYTCILQGAIAAALNLTSFESVCAAPANENA